MGASLSCCKYVYISYLNWFRPIWKALCYWPMNSRTTSMSDLEGFMPVKKMNAHLNSVLLRKPFLSASYFANACSIELICLDWAILQFNNLLISRCKDSERSQTPLECLAPYLKERKADQKVESKTKWKTPSKTMMSSSRTHLSLRAILFNGFPDSNSKSK